MPMPFLTTTASASDPKLGDVVTGSTPFLGAIKLAVGWLGGSHDKHKGRER